MASCIILCFTLTLFSILTINSYSNAKVAATTSLNAAVDSTMHALQLEETYNADTYEEIVGELMQKIILQTDPNGILNVKILNANIEEGLIDVEVSKQFIWLGIKKDIKTRRTVILDEYEKSPSAAVSVFFKYDGENGETVWRQEDTFIGALLRRPKQPKKAGYDFVGWTTDKNNTTKIITNEEWQNYIIPNVTSDPKCLELYAVFTPKA
jgi:uncharacterized repeat protein (TIGR02543 family)